MFICLGWATTQPLHLNLKSLCVFTMCCAILQAMLQNVPANGRYGQSPCTSGSFCISWTWCPSSWELGLMSSNDWTVPDIMHEGSLRIPFRKELRSFLHLSQLTGAATCYSHDVLQTVCDNGFSYRERKRVRWKNSPVLVHHFQV